MVFADFWNFILRIFHVYFKQISSLYVNVAGALLQIRIFVADDSVTQLRNQGGGTNNQGDQLSGGFRQIF